MTTSYPGVCVTGSESVLQLLGEVQLLLWLPVQVIVDALACRFHSNNIIAPRRNAISNRLLVAFIISTISAEIARVLSVCV